MNRRVLKTKHFARWMKKIELTDESLCSAVDEMQQGLIDADLGGNLYKKRGGARTLLATNLDNRWFLFSALKKVIKPTYRMKKKSSHWNWQQSC